MTLRAFLATTALLAAAPALAQSNQLFIIQEGSNNSLSVDQSRAENSSVGALRLEADPADLISGEFADPSGASVGVLGLDDFAFESQAAARQTGNGNEIEVTIEGSDGQVFFSQSASATGTGTGNAGTIGVTGDGLAALLQEGSGNRATLNVTGPGARAAITQLGNGNEGELLVSGQSAEALLLQNGNQNVATGLEVGGVGASFVLQQIGDGLNASGTTVSTSAPGVTIIQRPLATSP